MMGRGKHTDQFAFNQKRNGHLGMRILLTCDVVGIHGDVRRVAHLTGSRDIADQSLFANLEAVPLVFTFPPSTPASTISQFSGSCRKTLISAHPKEQAMWLTILSMS